MYYDDSVEGVLEFCESEGQPTQALEDLVAELDRIIADPCEFSVERLRELRQRKAPPAGR